MKRRISILSIMFVILFICFSIACNINITTKVTESETYKSSVDIITHPGKAKVGQIIQMKASSNDVVWSSGDTKVATVDQNTGKVITKGEGVALIVATLKSKNTVYDYITFNVKGKAKPDSVDITNNPGNLLVGKSVTLKATVKPDNLANKGVVWEVDDKSLATIDSNGNLTAKKAGKILVVAYSKADQTVYDYVYVNATGSIKPTSVDIVNNPSSLKVGASVQLSAKISPSNATNKNVVWDVDDKSIATIDSNGKLTAKKTGTVIVVAYSKVNQTVYDYVNVKIVSNSVKPTDVTISGKVSNLKVGNTAQLTATVSPSNVTNKNVVWQSGDTSVATVDQKGKVTAKGAGTAIIVAYSKADQSKYDYITFKVQGSPKVNSIKITKAPKTLKVKENSQIKAEVQPSNVLNKNIYYESKTPKIATVDQTGKITAVAPGQAIIVAYSVLDKNKSDYVTFNVTDARGVVNRESVKPSLVKIENNPGKLQYNNTCKLGVNVLPTTTPYKEVIWSSSDTSIATVDKNGNVKTYNKSGVVEIKVMEKTTKLTDKIIISVEKPPKENIDLEITYAPKLLFIGESFNLQTNASKKSKVSWSSSNPSAISIDKNGKVTSKGIGRATITATLDDSKASIDIESVLIEKTEKNYTIPQGNTKTIRIIFKSSNTFNPDEYGFKWNNNIYNGALISSTNKKHTYKSEIYNSKNVIKHTYSIDVQGKKIGDTFVAFSMSTSEKQINIKIISKEKDLRLQCPDIKYANDKITVNIKDKNIKSWDYYTTIGQSGSGAVWNYKGTATTSKTLDFGADITQGKIVVKGKDGSSRSCYTLPYKDKLNFYSTLVTHNNSIACPRITEKKISTTSSSRAISRSEYIWNTGVSKYSATFSTGAKKGYNPDYQYAWFISTKESESSYKTYGSTTNYQTTVNVAPYGDGTATQLKLVIMDENGDVNICGTNNAYTTLDFDRKAVIEGTNLYFQTGYSRTDEFINFIKNLPKEYKYGASLLLFYNTPTYDRFHNTNPNFNSQAVSWDSTIVFKDTPGDYNKYTIIHELGHTLDNLYGQAYSGKDISSRRDMAALHDTLTGKMVQNPSCDNQQYLRRYSYRNQYYFGAVGYPEFWADILEYSYLNENNINLDFRCNVNQDIIDIKNKYMNEIKNMTDVSKRVKATYGYEITK